VASERVAVLGMSATVTCGARDHATLLARSLDADGLSCSWQWLERRASSLRGSRSEVAAWALALERELERDHADVALLHYSAFAYSHRGVPLYAHPALAALRRTRTPIVIVMHEYAYPWRLGDWRGNVWALTQRAALYELIRACSAAVASTDFRVAALASERWLPRRPVALAPIYSNLPAPRTAPRRQRSGHVIGLFGYAFESAAVALVLDALGVLRTRGLDVRLRLLGGPGRDSHAGRGWQLAAAQRRLDSQLSFSGILPAQELSDALADCDALLFADSPGPTSRKGTLAGSLASGSPVIATDGPRTWQALVEADAARVVAPSPRALADAVAAVLADEQLRDGLGARGRAFAEQQMSVQRTADVVEKLFGEVLGGGSAAVP
jgi:glycosyltransferase involved in cell wall biosynthesis